MRSSGAFLLGAWLTFAICVAVGWYLIVGWVNSQGTNSFAGFGAGILFLYMLGGALVIALVAGGIAARHLRHPGYSTAGYVLTGCILTFGAWFAYDYNRRLAEDQVRSQAYVADYDRRMAPERNAAFKAEVSHRQAVRSEIPGLLGDWMPLEGELQMDRCHQDEKGEWGTIVVFSFKENPENLTSRIALDGWAYLKETNYESWKHAPLAMPGNGQGMMVEVIRNDDRRVALILERPGFYNYGNESAAPPRGNNTSSESNQPPSEEPLSGSEIAPVEENAEFGGAPPNQNP